MDERSVKQVRFGVLPVAVSCQGEVLSSSRFFYTKSVLVSMCSNGIARAQQ